jgi:hypothetical protein
VATIVPRTTTRPDLGRSIGFATAGLAGASLIVLAAAGPHAVHLAGQAGRVGEGAGLVAVITAGIFLLVVAASVWSTLTTTTRRMRVRPLAASAVAFALTLTLALRVAVATITGDGYTAGLCLGFLLFAAIGAGFLFGVASAPLASPIGRD